MTAAELERLMVEQFGEDFREKAIVTPTGSFALRDAFAECGLDDPRRPPPPASPYGLFQLWGSPAMTEIPQGAVEAAARAAFENARRTGVILPEWESAEIADREELFADFRLALQAAVDQGGLVPAGRVVEAFREARRVWEAELGGGMAFSFDTAYWDAQGAGASPVEAQRLGVHAVLDAMERLLEEGLRS